ncbi:MAG: glycerol-3-phosphate 1-O-acyltransferase PlsY [Bacteroidetes bacterium]|nr:glycerol-3-phosphate 1-O-acyltransferase PlsY [Bacteroidota bacterium]
MNLYLLIAAILAAYAIGSVPTAVWAGRFFHGIDVREHGSGNAGATNTIRVLGWKTGVPVLLIDVLKGWLASSLPVWIFNGEISQEQLLNVQIVSGLTAIIGHIFPVWAGFRGGKGVATTFGFLLALSPLVTLICFGVFIAVLLLTGFVSLSSILAGVSFALLVLTLFKSPSQLFIYFSVFVALALIVTHRKNISRLIKGEEKKFTLKKRSDH